MRKVVYTGTFILLGVMSMLSCRKDYHCSCTYNNNLVYTKDIGSKTKSDAQKACNVYDTTIKGETWNCTIY